MSNFESEQSLIEQAIADISQSRPGVDVVLQRYESLPLAEYSATVLGERLSVPDEQTEDLRLVADVIAEQAQILEIIYGEKVTGAVKKSVINRRVVDTGPHHGIFAHPFLVNDMALTALGRINSPEDCVVVLADSSVPLGNLSYPAGWVLTETRHDRNSGTVVPIRIAISPNDRDTAMMSALPFSRAELDVAKSRVGTHKANGEIKSYKARILNGLLIEIGKRGDILGLASLSNQTTAINSLIFERMFAPDLRENLPMIAYLDCDKTMTMVLKSLLTSGDPLFTALIFDKQIRRDFIALTGQIAVMSSTDLFTATTKGGPRATLRLSDTKEDLETEAENDHTDKSSVHLDLDTIISKIDKGELYAGPALIFAMLSHYGIDCTGGFNQSIGYLPKFLSGYARMLENSGFNTQAARVRTADSFRISTTLAIAFIERNGQLEQAGALDIMAKRNADMTRGLGQQDLENIRRLTLGELVRVNIPPMYRMVVPTEAQNHKILELTTDKIAAALGIKDQLVVIQE